MIRGVYTCDRCRRPTAKARLTPTKVGTLCEKCVNHLPRNLRKTITAPETR